MAHERPEIIAYGYDMAPNPQKLFQFLALFKIPFKYVEIPSTMPRPQFAELGITYRRTPLLSIGSDMYVDTALILEKLSDIARHSDCGLADATNHIEYDGLGQVAFQCATSLVPSDSPFLKDEHFLADRMELSGKSFDPAVLTKIRPQAISKLLSLIGLVESHFLREDRQFFLGGATPSTADMHLYWGLNWALKYHAGAQPEVSESTRPKIFKWLSDVEAFIKDRRLDTKMDMDDARKVLQAPPKHEYAKFVHHAEENPEGLSVGQKIKVTPLDTGRSGPQVGELISLNYEQVCLRNEKKLVMHFPRLGYEIVAV